jgi:hypothetical protein
MQRVLDRRHTSKNIVGRPENESPLARPGRRWKDIQIILKHWVWGIDWIYVDLHRDQWQAV